MQPCPVCGSDDVKKSSAVYEQGQFKSSAQTGGIGVASGGQVGAYQSKTSGETISTVAEKNAPPAVGGGVIAMGIIGMAGLMLLTALLSDDFIAAVGRMVLISVVGTIAIAVLGLSSVSGEKQKKANERYERQWYCLRCGSIFDGTVASQKSSEA